MSSSSIEIPRDAFGTCLAGTCLPPMTMRDLISRWAKSPRKYELLRDDKVVDNGQPLYRIRALRSFGAITKGDLGGYIAGEQNLSHRGTCWVFGNAKVSDRARVSGHATVGGKADIRRESEVKGMAIVHDAAKVCDEASIAGQAYVAGEARVGGHARVEGRAKVTGTAKVSGHTVVRAPIEQAAVLGADKDSRVCDTD